MHTQTRAKISVSTTLYEPTWCRFLDAATSNPSVSSSSAPCLTNNKISRRFQIRRADTTYFDRQESRAPHLTSHESFGVSPASSRDRLLPQRWSKLYNFMPSLQRWVQFHHWLDAKIKEKEVVKTLSFFSFLLFFFFFIFVTLLYFRCVLLSPMLCWASRCSSFPVATPHKTVSWNSSFFHLFKHC